MIDDYIEYTNKYKAIYGEKTIVLIEVGSFFEIYAIKNDNTDEGASDIYIIADLCNFVVTRKNKTILEVSHKNHLMAGFPSYALSKHSQTLLNNNYTVVLVEQVSSPPNPERKVTQILSPSMQISVNKSEGNYLMVTYWDIHKDITGNRFFSLGIAGVDVSTGRTWIYEIMRSSGSALDEFTRCFQMYQPSEIVFIGSNLTLDERYKIEETKIDGGSSYHLLWDIDIEIYKKVSYQNQVIEKAYSNTGILKGLEALSIENYENARIAFSYMIQFGYEHNSSIIKNLIYPEHLHFEGHCTLEYNSTIQLQLISATNNEKSLLSILNRCSTAFAMRRFRERLLQPINNVSILKDRYEKIQNMIDSNNSYKIRDILKSVLDIERMVRRMIINKFNPSEWTSFHNSFESIMAAQKLLNTDTSFIENIMNDYIKIIDIDEASKYTLNEIKGNIFKIGNYAEIDTINRSYLFHLSELDKIANSFEEGAKVEYNTIDGYKITMTKKRWEKVKSQNYTAKLVSQNSSIVRLTNKFIEDTSHEIINLERKLVETVTKTFFEFVATFIEKNKDNILKIINDVAELDIICTCARNAVDYHYKYPKISQCNRLEAINLRHPIIEIINTKYKYIPNDISFNNEKNLGLLLFGMNSSGKSSFMKAIGLNIIMAQAGMFVAADDFEYMPYNHIFTRIAGNDNIYKGWSTFTIEMLELKTILERANENSLVLGDELCSGTEAISALAIVAAGIDILLSKQSTFIFATHLHNLVKLEIIRNSNKIAIAHMHVEVDRESGLLVFDRKLRKGVGSEMYGLEVCKGLSLPAEFIKLAHEIRCEITGISTQFVATKVSRYNSEVTMAECKICGENATESHHINPQILADKNGFIDHFHKNREFNLIAVCDSCHNKIHYGILEVHGYKETSEGKKVDYNITDAKSILYDKIKYINNEFYIKKTKRSKWMHVSQNEIISFCRKKGIDDEICKKFILEFQKFDFH